MTRYKQTKLTDRMIRVPGRWLWPRDTRPAALHVVELLCGGSPRASKVGQTNLLPDLALEFCMNTNK